MYRSKFILTDQEQLALQAREMRYLRKLERITRRDRIRNTTITWQIKTLIAAMVRPVLQEG